MKANDIRACVGARKSQVVAAIMGLFFSTAVLALTPFAYIQLTAEMMQHRAQEYERFAVLAVRFRDSPAGWRTMETDLHRQSDAEIGKLYSRYGVDEREFLSYYSANPQIVGAYLDANPDQQERLHGLQERMEKALADFEAQKAKIGPEALR
ncbi:hypothetical protein [Candidatus Thiodictyon syntrophicum]|jgi:hypothetical protein|uniref:Uncharacterized protein n=1 Tax=Candidatus Thiodictyon syntrophicum TaxID=1166950 RepID=A0A2K8U904_9GAMM|nr:hypothetical protein [Candidatus Thiodictyon syntrophicum]AUB82044.1 hypothetical protein THSYN_14555 [Candidatus Thiodictyon syntrophicum]